MHATSAKIRNRLQASQGRLQPLAAGAVLSLGLLGVAPPAIAVDGCRALLCLAAPSWRDIPECVPTIQQLLRDLARGKPFPICGMSGGGNSAGNQWTSAPTFCPPQYTRAVDTESGTVYSCDYGGCISVSMNGSLYSRTWWNFGGDTVTEFSPNAKAMLRSWDTKFDDDFARWLALLPPPAPVDASAGL